MLGDVIEKEITTHGHFHKNALNQIQLAQLLELKDVKNDAEFLKRQYRFIMQKKRKDDNRVSVYDSKYNGERSLHIYKYCV